MWKVTYTWEGFLRYQETPIWLLVGRLCNPEMNLRRKLPGRFGVYSYPAQDHPSANRTLVYGWEKGSNRMLDNGLQ